MNNTERFANFLEELSPERVNDMDELYAEKLEFKDPLNEAKNLEHLKKIEADLFKQLKEISFEIISTQGIDQEAFVSWVMRYRFRFWQRKIEGVSHVKFNDEDKIHYQYDYWDGSFPIYGEFPPLGWIMKVIKKVLAVTQ